MPPSRDTGSLEPGKSESVERLAQWLYDRDAAVYIRVGWDMETDGLRDRYLIEAESALRVADGRRADA